MLDRSCAAVGASSLIECSTAPSFCGKRFAHESLLTNHVSKLALMFEKEAACTHDSNRQSRTGNPARSEFATQYLCAS